MEVESVITPLYIRLNNSIRRYAFRLRLLSLNHLVRAKYIEITDPKFNYTSDSSEPTSIVNRKFQLEAIIKSISTLVDFDSLEDIKPFYFPPWNREVPYTIEINSEPKDIAAISHIEYLKTLYNSPVTSIYTDASSLGDGKGIGIGLVVYDHMTPYLPATPIFRDSWNIGNNKIVYNGELEGVI